MSPITAKPHPLYAARLWRMGKSIVFPLAAAVCDALSFQPGDLLLVWVHPPFITVRLADLGNLKPIHHFGQDELMASFRNLLEQMEVMGL